MKKINTIIRKEWAEVFKNRMVLFTVIFLPLILTALPLIILYATGTSNVSGLDSQLPDQFSAMCPPEMNGGECFQVYMVSQFMLMFMMMPLAIPIAIAAYSVVGEKTTRSLEPLLATPITTLELLVGKSLAAAIPAVIATYGSFGLFVLGAYLITRSGSFVNALTDPRWLIAIFIAGPLMAIMAINVSLIVSSRVNDPRAAEQLSMVVIIPLMALFFAQIAGVIVLNAALVSIASLILVAVDILLTLAAVKLFQREVILTRWK